MSQENVEIVRRYLEEVPAPGSLGVGRRVLGARRRLLPGSQVPGGEAMPRTRGDRALPHRVPCGLGGYRYVVKDARAIGDDRVLVHGHSRQRDARAAWRWKATSTTASGSGMDDSSGVEDHLTAKGALHALGLSGETLEAAGLRE